MFCDCEAPKCGGNSRIIRARKPYKCCDCDIDINPGEQYSRCDGVWEWGATTYCTCLSCSQVREKMQELSGDCIAFGCLEEWIYESDFFEEDDEDENEFLSCTIATLVPWLRRGYNGRFELVEESNDR